MVMPMKRPMEEAPGMAKAMRVDNDSWSCPSCGNVNYGGKTVCNMRKCQAPRPVENWICPGCGNENYANRLFCNMRRCQLARPGLTAANFATAQPQMSQMPPQIMRVHQAPQLQQAPQHVQIAVPAQSWGPGPGAPAGHTGGGKGGGKGGKDAPPGSWACLSCGNVNWPMRSTCNGSKCGRPRHEVDGGDPNAGGGMGCGGYTQAWSAPPPAFNSMPPQTSFATVHQPAPARDNSGSFPPGSWKCISCGNVNFPARTTCNARNCGKPREEVDGGEVSVGPGRGAQQESNPEGSWTCPSCNNVNWPQRTACNKRGCGMPRPDLGGPQSF